MIPPLLHIAAAVYNRMKYRASRPVATSAVSNAVRGRCLALTVLTFHLFAHSTWAQQEPTGTSPPNYEHTRVTYHRDGIELAGILWTPNNPGPHPALVLVDGSGKTTADDMEPWARRFTQWGFVCLSYDKRGVGSSGGTYIGGYDIDIPRLARDALAGVQYLKTLAATDNSRIGLLGASQAGWVIPAAAAKSSDVAFMVVYSGTTVSLGEEDYFSRLSGDDPFWRWIYRDLTLEEISRRLAEEEPSLYDPLPDLIRLTVPGLWLYGELDRSQPTRESVEILDELIETYDKNFSYKVFKGADHSLRIDGELADGVFELVEEWLVAQGTMGH